MYDNNDVPDPVADDAPRPDEFEPGEEVRTPGSHLTDLVAVDHDGMRFCLECASDDYIEFCRGDPTKLPAGGPVTRGAEVDCPGYACDHCGRRIADLTVLHYDGVCHPASCTEMDAET